MPLSLPHPAAAITHQDNLEFLDDTIPKTQPYREVKQKAAETRAKLTGGVKPTTAAAAAAAGDGQLEDSAAAAHHHHQTNGKKQKTLSNGFGVHDVVKNPESPAAQHGAGGDDDVQMTG